MTPPPRQCLPTFLYERVSSTLLRRVSPQSLTVIDTGDESSTAVIGVSTNISHPRRCYHGTHRNWSGKKTKNDSSSKEEAPFDRHAKWRQRTRAAESCRNYYNNYIQASTSRDNNIAFKPKLPYDYFHKEVANRLVERLDDICVREEGFPLTLEIGAGAGFVYEAIVSDSGLYPDIDIGVGNDELSLMEKEYLGGRGGIRKLVQLDSSSEMLHRDDLFRELSAGQAGNGDKNNSSVCETYKLVAEEEQPLPFPDGTFDLVISSMAFHWINDLPRLLTEIKRTLKPDGCLLFALPGGNTLPELRSSLILAELERTGGVSTHVGPYMDISDVGSLLTGTGFRLPTIDVDEIQIGYPNMMVLMEHLGRMGEGNASVNRRDRVGLGTFLGGACIYRELYPVENPDKGGENDESDGGCASEREEGVVASAQIIYGIAWKEHESQQTPLERGSATRKMSEISVTKTSGRD
mmetsp:Transcript_9885/g.18405  ORF Transcript_9885/g.18405 Transcript_9885/m.18405 type:complete len:464 (-) Transcript_9885:42-1433(-)